MCHTVDIGNHGFFASCVANHMLKLSPQELRAERDLLLKAVCINGLCLKYASKDLRGDRKIVMRAVEDTGAALKFGSPALRNDEEVVKKALTTDVLSLKHASERLKEELFCFATRRRVGLIGMRVHLLSGRQTILIFRDCLELRSQFLKQRQG